MDLAQESGHDELRDERAGKAASMTIRSLTPGQRRTLEIITELVFGRIELLIVDGQPCHDPPPRIVQEIRLASAPERQPDHANTDGTLTKEFEALFNHLANLRNASIDIECRHSLPFRLLVRRHHNAAGRVPVTTVAPGTETTKPKEALV